MPAAKRNMAARVARGKYLAIFDDDTEIRPGCIEEMVRLIESNTEIAMVYAKCLKFDEPHRFDEAGGFLTWSGFIWSRAEQNIEDTGQYDKPEPIFAGKSAACLVKRVIWEKLDGMDEDFGILGEESDISWRMWLAGYEVWWCPKAVALHKFNTPLKPVDKHYTSSRVHFNGPCNYLTMLLKNLGGEHLWIILIHLLVWFTASIAMIGTGKVKQGWNILRGIGSFIWNVPSILRKRERIQSHRESEKRVWTCVSRTPKFSYYTYRFWRYISSCLHG